MSDDIKDLINAFNGYRDLLTPVQKGLADFVGTYDSMRENISKLESAFSGDIKANLENVFTSLSAQAEKASDLSGRIEKFTGVTERYVSEITKMLALVARVESKLATLNEIETNAEEQIGKLDKLLTEKKVAYNVTELEKTLANYNVNVQKMSDFINRDVITNLENSRKKLDEATVGIENILKTQKDEKVDIGELLEKYSATCDLLKKIAEKGEINETYIFEVLDNWADSRKVKTKR